MYNQYFKKDSNKGRKCEVVYKGLLLTSPIKKFKNWSSFSLNSYKWLFFNKN